MGKLAWQLSVLESHRCLVQLPRYKIRQQLAERNFGAGSEKFDSELLTAYKNNEGTFCVLYNKIIKINFSFFI